MLTGQQISSADRPMTEIESEAERLRADLSRLSANLDALRERLQPVLLPMPPAEPKAQIAAVPGSDLGRTLRQFSDQADDLAALVGRTLAELAL